MTIGESFKRAYDVVGKNWPLVLVNIVSSIILLVLFGLMVVLPLMSLTGASEFHYSFNDPQELKEFLTGPHLKAALVGCLVFLFWALVASVIGIYIYAGALGVMKEALLREDWKFSLSGFFKEANKQFWPVMGYLAVLFLVGVGFVLAWVVFFVVLGFAGTAFKSVPQGGMAVVVSVLGVFLFIAVAVVMLGSVFICASLGAYGATVVVFRDASVWGALKRAWVFLWANQRAFWGFVLSLCILWVVAIGLALGGLIVQVIPGLGKILALPYDVFSMSVEVFATYWSTAVAMSFYEAHRRVYSP